MRRNRIAVSFLIGIWFLAINDGQAADNQKWFCATDKETYQQGENVIITLTNGSGEAVTIVDRTYIDGGFATIERKHSDGTWQPIELYVAANITSFRPLKKGESHRYIWKTVGYNRTNTVADSGAYKIKFHQGMISNQFFILEKARSSQQ